jgi:protein-disulfide isomerase
MLSSLESRARFLAATALILVVTAGVLGLATRTCAASSQGGVGTPENKTPVAVVDGQPITLEELEASLGTSLTKLEQDLYNLKKERLDSMIGERLLAREAGKRGVEVKQLVETEITAKIPPVTDQEVDAFYETNKARLPTAPDIKSQIKQFLASQRAQARGQAYIAELRSSTKVDVALAAPPVRRATVPVEGAPIRGTKAAPITIVEFSDFHCPFCKKVQPTLMEVLAKYPDKVRLIYKDLPLEGLHPQARRASEAARCAGDQGKFWEYHDKIYAGGPDVAPEYLRKLATDVGLELKAFETCLADGKHKPGIQTDLDQASQLGLSGTPAFFINGRPLSGAQPLDAFVKIIDDELQGQGSR